MTSAASEPTFCKLTSESILEVCFSLVKNKIDLSERSARVSTFFARLHACLLTHSFVRSFIRLFHKTHSYRCVLFLLFNTSMILCFASTKLALVFNFYFLFFSLGAHRANTKKTLIYTLTT